MGYLTAKVDTSKYRGKVGKGITVYTDDPRTPNVRLTLRATIRSEVAVLPREMVRLGNRTRLENETAIIVHPEDEDAAGRLNIHDARASVPWLTVSVARLDKSRPAAGELPAAKAGDWLVTTTLGDDAPFGNSRERIWFQTGLERQSMIQLPVIVYRAPPVNLSPSRIELRAPVGAAAPESAQGTVLFSVRNGLDPSGLSVSGEPPELDLKLEPSGPRNFKLHLEWPGTEPGAGTVSFQVGEETYEVQVLRR